MKVLNKLAIPSCRLQSILFQQREVFHNNPLQPVINVPKLRDQFSFEHFVFKECLHCIMCGGILSLIGPTLSFDLLHLMLTFEAIPNLFYGPSRLFTRISKLKNALTFGAGLYVLTMIEIMVRRKQKLKIKNLERH